MILASVADSLTSWIIKPKDFLSFWVEHMDCEVVFHNVAFDFWVIARHLANIKDGHTKLEELRSGKEIPWERRRSTWFAVAHHNKFHDLMLLDQLYRLGSRPNVVVPPRDLGVVAGELGVLGVDKASSYRMRYAELRGRESEWDQIARDEPGWFEYPRLDARATYDSWVLLESKAQRLVEATSGRSYTTSPQVRRFGLLTEQVQVKAAIALADVGRRGFAVDTRQVDAVESKILDGMRGDEAWIRENYPQVLTFVGFGSSTRAKRSKTGSVSFNMKALRRELSRLYSKEAGPSQIIPTTAKSGDVSTTLELWRELLPREPLVQRWSSLVESGKLLGFVSSTRKQNQPPFLDLFSGLVQTTSSMPASAPVVRTTYDVLKVTGRTGSRSPNLQNFPRDPEFRRMFVAREGYLLVVADYSTIELVTLADVLLWKIGWSRLAETIKAGVDPHAFTAAHILKIKPEDWAGYAKDHPKEAKLARQRAKPINFGVPGGMGDENLQQYARSQYGVEFSLETAHDLRQLLISEVYPEIGEYLQSDDMGVLARKLGCEPSALWRTLGFRDERPGWVPHVVRKIVEGHPYKKDGTPYDTDFVDRVWAGLSGCCCKAGQTNLLGDLSHRRGSRVLAEGLFRDYVVTTTGRVRAGVSYTEARNTPFQGLAADGAKLAGWNLLLAGARSVAFVHDEYVVEWPEATAHTEGTAVVSRCMVEGMRSVLRNDLPVKVSVEVSRAWEKP